MIVYAVVFVNNPKELAGDPNLFTDQGEAEKARDQWNADVGACETRSAEVVSMTVQVKEGKFRNPTVGWSHNGKFSVELTEGAETCGLPRAGVTLEGRVVTVSDGRIWQGMGGIQFETSNGSPFRWGYKGIEAIRDANGDFLWINHEGKYASELKK